jgi:4-amino-4-deoxy-L-arabinose transferase-like glycosyltransferase
MPEFSVRGLHRIASILFLILVVLYLAFLGFNSLRYEGRFSPDSAYYIDTARNIVAGRGISNSMTPVRAAVESGETLPRPMTMWGPLYPLLIAVSSITGLPAPAGALGVPVVFLGIILVGSYLLMRGLFDATVALLGVGFLLHFAPLRLISIYAWSDAVGLAFAVLMFYAVMRLHHAEGTRANLCAALAGLAAGMAYAARYALLPLFPLGMLLLIERKSLKETAKNLGFMAVFFLVVAAPVAIRNLLLTGHLQGARTPSGWGVPFNKACADLFRVVAETAAPESWPARLVYTALLAAMAAMCVVRIRRRTLVPVLRETVFAGKRHLLALWPAGYLAFLLYCKTRMPIDPINARLTVPATLFLVLLFVSVLVRVVGAKPLVFTSVSMILAVLAVGNEIPTARAVMRTNVPRVYDFEHKLAYSETLTWLSNNVTDRDLVVAEDGLDLPLYLGTVNTLYFLSVWPPTYQFSQADFTDYLERYCGQYEHVYLVLQKDPQRPTLEAGSFLAELAADPLNPKPGIALKAKFKDGLIYQIDWIP